MSSDNDEGNDAAASILGESGRKRVTLACEGCKQARRKCSGIAPCGFCAKRKIECVFGQAQKRGPKTNNDRMKATSGIVKLQDAARTARHIPQSAAAPMAAATSAAVPRSQRPPLGFSQLPPRLSLSPDEQAVLRSFFDFTNRILPVVEESFFYADLDAADTPRSADATDDDGRPWPITEAPGLRVCCYMLLCVGSKLHGKHRAAKRYYDMARASIGPAYQQPTQHLVSALLLMTILTRSVCPDDDQAMLHAALALRMADLVPELSPEIRLSAVMFNYAHSAPEQLVWPTAQAPVGTEPHVRFADVLGFVISQLMIDFVGVTPELEGRFIQLLNESLVLQFEHGLYRSFPLLPTVYAMKALLAYRAGEAFVHETLDNAISAFVAAKANPLYLLCFPCVFALARLVPLSREAVCVNHGRVINTPELVAKASRLGTAAVEVIRESKSSFASSSRFRAARADLEAHAAAVAAGGAALPPLTNQRCANGNLPLGAAMLKLSMASLSRPKAPAAASVPAAVPSSTATPTPLPAPAAAITPPTADPVAGSSDSSSGTGGFPPPLEGAGAASTEQAQTPAAPATFQQKADSSESSAAFAMVLSASLVVESQGGSLPPATRSYAEDIVATRRDATPSSSASAAGAPTNTAKLGAPAPPPRTGLDVLLVAAMGGPDAEGMIAPDDDMEAPSAAAAVGLGRSGVGARSSGTSLKRRHASSPGVGGVSAAGHIDPSQVLGLTAAVAPKIRRRASLVAAASFSASAQGSFGLAADGSKQLLPAPPPASAQWGSPARTEQQALAAGMSGVVPALLPLQEDHPTGTAVATSSAAGQAAPATAVAQQRQPPPRTQAPPLFPWPPPSLQGAQQQPQQQPLGSASAPTTSAELRLSPGSAPPQPPGSGSSLRQHLLSAIRSGSFDEDDFGALVGSTFGDLSPNLDLEDDSIGTASSGSRQGRAGSGIGRLGRDSGRPSEESDVQAQRLQQQPGLTAAAPASPGPFIGGSGPPAGAAALYAHSAPPSVAALPGGGALAGAGVPAYFSAELDGLMTDFALGDVMSML